MNIDSVLLDPPKFPLFIKFPLKTGAVNLAEKISTDFHHFGILLLDDDDGTKTDAIVRQYRDVAKDINSEIFKEWLKEGGKEPVAWDTLASVLHDIGLKRLAKDIKEVI